MRSRSSFIVLAALAGLVGPGCGQMPTRRSPAPPALAADPSASGEQRVRLDLMRRMAEQDAASASARK